jgi:hypothetical protein
VLSRNCVFVSKEVKDIALPLLILEVSGSNLGSEAAHCFLKFGGGDFLRIPSRIVGYLFKADEDTLSPVH